MLVKQTNNRFSDWYYTQIPLIGWSAENKIDRICSSNGSRPEKRWNHATKSFQNKSQKLKPKIFHYSPSTKTHLTISNTRIFFSMKNLSYLPNFNPPKKKQIPLPFLPEKNLLGIPDTPATVWITSSPSKTKKLGKVSLDQKRSLDTWKKKRSSQVASISRLIIIRIPFFLTISWWISIRCSSIFHDLGTSIYLKAFVFCRVDCHSGRCPA